MSEEFRSFFIMLKAIAIFIALGISASFIFYSLKKKELFGGFIGGLVVGVIGAIIGGLILDKFLFDWIEKLWEFLIRGAGVNIIAGFVGAYFAVYVMNKLNHDKDRKKY